MLNLDTSGEGLERPAQVYYPKQSRGSWVLKIRRRFEATEVLRLGWGRRTRRKPPTGSAVAGARVAIQCSSRSRVSYKYTAKLLGGRSCIVRCLLVWFPTLSERPIHVGADLGQAELATVGILFRNSMAIILPQLRWVQSWIQVRCNHVSSMCARRSNRVRAGVHAHTRPVGDLPATTEAFDRRAEPHEIPKMPNSNIIIVIILISK